jgi:hypothetical protein
MTISICYSFPQFQVSHVNQMCLNNKVQKCGDGHFPDILRFKVFTMVTINSEASSDVETCSLVTLLPQFSLLKE